MGIPVLFLLVDNYPCISCASACLASTDTLFFYILFSVMSVSRVKGRFVHSLGRKGQCLPPEWRAGMRTATGTLCAFPKLVQGSSPSTEPPLPVQVSPWPLRVTLWAFGLGKLAKEDTDILILLLWVIKSFVCEPGIPCILLWNCNKSTNWLACKGKSTGFCVEQSETDSNTNIQLWGNW